MSFASPPIGTQLAEGTKKADLGEENQPPLGLLIGA
jgi:hypothetical protein